MLLGLSSILPAAFQFLLISMEITKRLVVTIVLVVAINSHCLLPLQALPQRRVFFGIHVGQIVDLVTTPTAGADGVEGRNDTAGLHKLFEFKFLLTGL